MSTELKGHILVDLDGTLAHYESWEGIKHIGEPIMPMLKRVERWIAEGKEVRIFTARVWPLSVPADQALPIDELATMSAREIEAWQAVGYIRAWCETHLGRIFHITCTKDFATTEIWDDRAVGVVPNLGLPHETVPAMHLYNLVQSLGIQISDGTTYDYISVVAMRRVERINELLRAAREARVYIDAAQVALSWKETGASDILLVKSTLAKCKPFLDAATEM